jgi:uncharacterized membrane protein
VRVAFTVLVFLIDLWALDRVFASDLSRRRRLVWTAIVVVLPLVGAWLWWRRERRTAAVSTSATPDPPNVPIR